MKEYTLSERGKFKTIISSSLYKNKDIREMLIGDTTDMSGAEMRKQFKKYCQSHLFIDDTITEAKTFIFYDVRIPRMGRTTKQIYVIMYLVCDRDILEDYAKEGYYGDRIDILSEMVEETLINDEEIAQSFGVGKIRLDSVDIYNSTRLYGCILNFDVSDFR